MPSVGTVTRFVKYYVVSTKNTYYKPTLKCIAYKHLKHQFLKIDIYFKNAVKTFHFQSFFVIINKTIL